MNERDYSAELYEKMRAEQEQYRNYLLGQRPEEILNHTWEYTMREDMVMAMETLDLTCLLYTSVGIILCAVPLHVLVLSRYIAVQINAFQSLIIFTVQHSFHGNKIDLAETMKIAAENAAYGMQMCIRDSH